MDRVVLLRWGYAALGLSFVAFAASTVLGAAALAGIALALVAGVLLALSGDDLPRWAGLALVLYFVVTLLVFLAATPVTVRLESFRGFVNDDPSPLAEAVFGYLVMAMPLMMAATGVASAWEREWPPRLLLWGSLAAFLLVSVLHVVLAPTQADELGAARGETYGRLMTSLFGLSGAVGALGALWAAARPDEYA